MPTLDFVEVFVSTELKLDTAVNEDDNEGINDTDEIPLLEEVVEPNCVTVGTTDEETVKELTAEVDTVRNEEIVCVVDDVIVEVKLGRLRVGTLENDELPVLLPD